MKTFLIVSYLFGLACMELVVWMRNDGGIDSSYLQMWVIWTIGFVIGTAIGWGVDKLLTKVFKL